MKKIIRLTESDLTRIVKQVINESPHSSEMDDDMSTEMGIGMYRKIKQTGDILEEEIKRLFNIRRELESLMDRSIQTRTSSKIFDPRKPTPIDVASLVSKMNSMIGKLEGDFAQYKRLIRNTISL